MPKLDGFGFLRLIQENNNHNNIKVLILSAKTLTEDLLQGYMLGAIDYVTKPFKSDLIKAKVERLLQLKFTQEIGEYKLATIKFLDDRIGNMNNIVFMGVDILDQTATMDDTGKTCVSMIKESIMAMQKFTQHLRTLTELSTNPPIIEIVNLGDLVNELDTKFLSVKDKIKKELGDQIFIFDPTLDIKSKINDNYPFLVYGNRKLLSQAFNDALENIVTLIHDDDILKIRMHQIGGFYIVDYIYDAEKIPDETVEALFKPMSASIKHVTMMNGAWGNGLGFAMAFLISKMCGGDLKYLYENGSGIFRFSFPIIGTTPFQQPNIQELMSR